jgi:hypothetical protein
MIEYQRVLLHQLEVNIDHFHRLNKPMHELHFQMLPKEKNELKEKRKNKLDLLLRNHINSIFINLNKF